MSDGARSEGSRPSPGVLASLRSLAATAVAMAHTRLQLLASDLEEQRIRVLQMLILGAAAFFCGAVALLLVSAWLVIALWDEYRLLTLGLLALVYFVGCVVASWRLRASIGVRPRLFAASIAELRRDEEMLRS